MNKYMVNMVHPKIIVQKGLKGCNTTRTVTTFAQKNRIPWVWWKPTANQKIMLVDWTQFREVWKKAGPEYAGKTFPNRIQTHKTNSGRFDGYGASTAPKYPTKIGTGRTRVNSYRSAGNKTNYRSNPYRRRNAA